MHSPRNWDEIEHEEGLSVLSEIRVKGFKLVMITNQPDIERKIVPAEFVEELHAFYKEKYSLDAVYSCPFSSNNHPDKKPNPGMLLRASQDHGIELKSSYFLGDTERDAGTAASCQCHFILYDRPYNKELKAGTRIYNLGELTKIVV